MKTVPCLALAFLALTTLSRSVPNGAAIRSVDFKNFSFPWDDDMAAPPSYGASPWRWLVLPQSKIHVENGAHHFYDEDQSPLERERAPLISVDAVTFGDLVGDGAEEAAVHLNYSTGGTQNWSYLYLCRIVRGQPEPMGVLKAGERGDGGLYRTAIQNGLLVLDFADPKRQSGDCCSEGYIRVRYHWKNGSFVEVGPREHGDIDVTPK